MNPILEFLQKHDDYSFDEGVVILLQYSSNAGVNNFIIRRRDRRHLHDELVRLAHNPYLRPLPSTKQVKQTQDKPESTENTETTESTETKDEVSVVSYLDLDRHKTYSPEELPTPFLKELWEKNRDEYKEMQHCHEMMKQANSDAGRAEWREQLLALRESIEKRWQLFDFEMKSLEENTPPATAKTEEFNVQSYRSYISKALKKDKWTDAVQLEVQHRIDAMLASNIVLSEQTLKQLKKRGIVIS